MVAIHLVKRWGDRVFFYHNGAEVDFYLPDAERLIQVAYSLDDPETLQRETESLAKVAKRLNVSDLLIITKDEETVLENKGKTINVVPLWKWLLARQ